MTHREAQLANAAAIEAYGRVMASKGLQARALWAQAEAKKIRDAITASDCPAVARAA